MDELQDVSVLISHRNSQKAGGLRKEILYYKSMVEGTGWLEGSNGTQLQEKK